MQVDWVRIILFFAICDKWYFKSDTEFCVLCHVIDTNSLSLYLQIMIISTDKGTVKYVP